MTENNLINNATSTLLKSNKEAGRDFLTGEVDLTLTHAELKSKILGLANGNSYLGVLELEHRALERQGVINGSITKDRVVVFKIPDWDDFISRVHAFHAVCGPY